MVCLVFCFCWVIGFRIWIVVLCWISVVMWFSLWICWEVRLCWGFWRGFWCGWWGFGLGILWGLVIGWRRGSLGLDFVSFFGREGFLLLDLEGVWWICDWLIWLWVGDFGRGMVYWKWFWWWCGDWVWGFGGERFGIGKRDEKILLEGDLVGVGVESWVKRGLFVLGFFEF